MSIFKKYGKMILLDGLAVLCFIGVILFGWLPGPGGIPLFLAGLALLAVNHDWAERWLETAKHKGKSFKSILFPSTPWIRHSYDAGSVILFLLSAYLFFTTKNRLLAGLSIALICLSVFVFLVNRERLDKILTLVRPDKHKHIK
jgi:predicted PurR-regulated permease PerM